MRFSRNSNVSQMLCTPETRGWRSDTFTTKGRHRISQPKNRHDHMAVCRLVPHEPLYQDPPCDGPEIPADSQNMSPDTHSESLLVASSASTETPSGKNTGTENFPVGSWLLSAPLRPYIATFYALARATDDIADNPDLSPEEKLARLDGFDAALTGKLSDDSRYEKSARLLESLTEIGVTTNHSRDLISAFKQDAVKLRYRDWDDLMDYCNRSAAPVGRFLLDLHGESRDGYAASDALCNALQVINHLQDCKDDYLALDRVYIPENWLAESDLIVAALGDTHASRELRAVLDRCLDGVEELLVTARTLPGRLKSRRLAMESAVIYRIAVRLTRLLRRNDPVAGRVALSPFSFFLCGAKGVGSVLFSR